MRKLRADEIECRVNTISEKGCSLLLYKDARVDMRILDETVGQMNWKREHKMIGNNLYCTISLWDSDKKCWISKEDVGVESYTEKEKGQASDSFKRAGTNWGIGRELYTAPFIWINAEDVNLIPNGKDHNGDNKYKTYDHFTVKDIGYDGDQISMLEIVNDKKKKTVYTFGGKLSGTKDNRTPYMPVLTPSEVDKDSTATNSQVEQIKSICEAESVPVEFITRQYNIDDIEELTRMQAYKMVVSWDRVKSSYLRSIEK